MFTAAQARLPVYEYSALQVKSAVTGYGRAEKSQVQQMVKALLRLGKYPSPTTLRTRSPWRSVTPRVIVTTRQPPRMNSFLISLVLLFTQADFTSFSFCREELGAIENVRCVELDPSGEGYSSLRPQMPIR